MNRPTLRNYQNNGIDQVDQAVAADLFNILLVLATGGGKTSVACEMIFRAVMKGKKVVFIAHRKELIEQAKARLAQFGIQAGVIMGKHKYRGDSVNVASVQTLANREMPEADIVFIDEAHHFVLTGAKPGKKKDEKNLPVWHQPAVETGVATQTTTKAKASIYKKVFDNYNGKAVIIGLTATPKRLDGKSLGDVFQEMVIPEVDGVPVDIGWLQDEGYLVKAKYFGAPIVADIENVHRGGGDFKQDELIAAFDKKELYEGVVENYQKHAGGKKAICFCININHAIKTMEEFQQHGISADIVEGSMNDHDREAALWKFKEGFTTVLINVGILTEGYDLPDIEAMVANRATDSESLWLQMIGRILRAVYAPGFDLSTKEGRLAAIAASHKPYAIVLDHGTNCKRLGFSEDRRQYSLDPAKKKKKGVAPVKECKESAGGCGALLGASARQCPECGKEFEIKSVEQKLSKAEFVELRANNPISLLPEHLRGRHLLDLSIKEIEEFRSSMKYPLGWAVRHLIFKAEKMAKAEKHDPVKVVEKVLQVFANIESENKKRYSNSWVSMEVQKYIKKLNQ